VLTISEDWAGVACLIFPPKGFLFFSGEEVSVWFTFSPPLNMLDIPPEFSFNCDDRAYDRLPNDIPHHLIPQSPEMGQKFF